VSYVNSAIFNWIFHLWFPYSEGVEYEGPDHEGPEYDGLEGPDFDGSPTEHVPFDALPENRLRTLTEETKQLKT